MQEKELVFAVDVLQLASEVGSRHGGVRRLGTKVVFEVAIKMIFSLRRKELEVREATLLEQGASPREFGVTVAGHFLRSDVEESKVFIQ